MGVMFVRVHGVAVCCVRVMGSFFMMPILLVFCCFAVMLCGVLVVLGCFFVMLMNVMIGHSVSARLGPSVIL